MSIKEERLRKTVNEIIREELRNGKFPSSQRVLWRLNQYLQEHDLDKPSNQLRIARQNHPTDPDDYNRSVEEIISDLSIIYDALIQFHNRTMETFRGFEIEKRKYEYQVDNMEKELQEIINSNNGQSYRRSIYDIFTDMEKVDPNYTDASVDIHANEATISKTNNQSVRIDVSSGTKVTFSAPKMSGVISKTATGDVNNIVNDKENLIWQQEIQSEKQVEIVGTLSISFSEAILMNQINIDLHSVKESMLMIEVSKDGDTWLLLPRYTSPIRGINNVSLTFPTMQIRGIRILISKTEADKLVILNDKPVYTYLYGIKNISFYRASYKKSSTLQSKVFDLKESDVFTIDKVYLDADADMPNGTSINYYIALDEENPKWIPISHMNDPHPKHNKIVDFHNIETAQPEVYTFPSTISIENVRQLNNLNVNGVKFYKLGSVSDKKIIPGTERLFCGKRAWKTDLFTNQFESGHVPTAADWVGKTYTTAYNNMGTKPNVLAANVNHGQYANLRYSCSVYSTTEQRVTSHKLMANVPCSVYMNGELIYSGISDSTTSVDYYFKRGWNDIIILTYVDSGSLMLDIGIDVSLRGQRIYAVGKPYQLVSLFDLQYNIRNNRKDVYAIIYINDEAVLVTNNYITDIEYEFFYKYTTETNTKTRVILKAELVRDSNVTQLSPKLKSYTLRFL